MSSGAVLCNCIAA